MLLMRSSLLGLLLLLFLGVGSGQEQKSKTAITDVLSAIVGIEASVPDNARTALALGTKRIGSGVVIDSSGLILTIGYLILEASHAQIYTPKGSMPATILAYDYESGLGLLRAQQPLVIKPLSMGDSDQLKTSDQVLIMGFGGPDNVQAAEVVSRRIFAGYWEYLLEKAIFTAPPHPAHSGAALIGPDGDLLGIGSLVVNDAAGSAQTVPGNMFVPISALEPILGDLLSLGRSSAPPRPWLGLFTKQHSDYVFTSWVAPDGPAAQAGLKSGELIVAVAGKPVISVEQLYRQIWSLGDAGVEVPLTVLRDGELVELNVPSGDRYNWLRMHPSL